MSEGALHVQSQDGQSQDGQPQDGQPQDGQLRRVVLEGETLTRLSPLQEADRAQAVADLEASNSFALPAREQDSETRPAPRIGPYTLHLSIQEGRLVFDIRHDSGARVAVVTLTLGPFRRLIKDYQLLVDSYATSVQEGREARMQAIDMGRRALHNEGAEMMMVRLKGRIAIDFETARRLFTLVCVLHQRI